MKKLNEITQVTLPDDFADMIDVLSNADGMMERVVLYCDENLRVVLEEMKFANRNIRGSYGGGEKLSRLYRNKGYQAVHEAVVKFCHKNNIRVMLTRVTHTYEEVK